MADKFRISQLIIDYLFNCGCQYLQILAYALH